MATQNLSRRDVIAQKKSISVTSAALTYADHLSTSADTYQLATIPPGSLITHASITVLTASDAATSAVADLGFAGDDTLIDGVDLKSAAGTVLEGGTNAVVPAFKETGGILTIKPTYTGATTAGEFLVTVEYIEVNKTSGEYTKFVN